MRTWEPSDLPSAWWHPGRHRHNDRIANGIAYTVAKVARLLDKHPNTIYEWVAKGVLPHQRIGGTIYIPKWALAGLFAPAALAESSEAFPPAGVRPHDGRGPLAQAVPALSADQAPKRVLPAP